VKKAEKKLNITAGVGVRLKRKAKKASRKGRAQRSSGPANGSGGAQKRKKSKKASEIKRRDHAMKGHRQYVCTAIYYMCSLCWQ